MFLGGVQMPITPGKLQLKIKGKNKTLTLVNDGEINFLKLPALTEITADVLLPALPSHYNKGGNTPDYYLGAFEKMVTELKPIRFIVSRTSPDGKQLFDTNLKVSVESYNILEDAGDGPDVTVALTLKQYKDFGTKTVQLVEQPPTPADPAPQPVAVVEKPREADAAPKTQTYTVVKGDCLYNIAKKYYGNGADYTKIYEANKDKISNPNLIYPGQELVIP
jgi:LysM repeat protein